VIKTRASSTDPATGYAYLTFDNSIQGGKGTAMFVSVSKDRGASWSSPVRLATFQNPVCLFRRSASIFRVVNSALPAPIRRPAFDPTTRRLYVGYSDIVGGLGQILLDYANVADITKWTTPVIVAPASGDRINVELSVEPSSGRLGHDDQRPQLHRQHAVRRLLHHERGWRQTPGQHGA